MSVGVYNWIWQQGEDLIMNFVYKEGPVGSETPVDLTGYSLRMDIVKGDDTRIFTFNSDDIPGNVAIDTVGSSDNEADLDNDGTISIVVSRALTLPGGAVYIETELNTWVFNYDIFLRSPSNKQAKILKGTITVEPSYTLWQ